ncbi:LacI family DNA-binding transcriptional regulator [Fodinicola acaciae]|uniref:LacI family DNA-binding transcriptional regulator n=1 Tax=Fodinicola acaciae TaxID=2681555 RepID=UPI0013D49DD6|nr:LacI family DNA-binding transcriptional regulator [Fodinicola acaciae]
MVTTKDVAALAGVSQATVSRVVHNHPGVTAQTRERVRAVLAQTGYQPNLAARIMRTRRSGTVGLVVDDVVNPFYPELIHSISAELAGRGLRMILWDSAGPGEESAIEAIDQRLVDGLVFTTATPQSKALSRAIQRGAPVVLVNRTVAELDCDQVDGDNRAKAHEVAGYFAAAGHRRVAIVDGPAAASTARERGAGFRAGCAAYGLDLVTRDGDFTFEAGRAAAADLDGATAVFCTNDLSALGVLDVVGRRVPDEVWVVGYDDVAMAGWDTFSLTTVRQPLADMAAAALDLLLQRIEQPSAPFTHRRFKDPWRIRRSTAHTPLEST